MHLWIICNGKVKTGHGLAFLLSASYEQPLDWGCFEVTSARLICSENTSSAIACACDGVPMPERLLIRLDIKQRRELVLRLKYWLKANSPCLNCHLKWTDACDHYRNSPVRRRAGLKPSSHWASAAAASRNPGVCWCDVDRDKCSVTH